MSESEGSGGFGEILAAGATPGAPSAPVAAPMGDLSSILMGSPGLFQVHLEQAPQAIDAFRRAAEQMRRLWREARMLADISPPGLDAVSLNAVTEIGRWAVGDDSGSLRSVLDQGMRRLDEAADALERSLQTYQQADQSHGFGPRKGPR